MNYNLFYYRKSNKIKNFGDELSPVIVTEIMKKYGYIKIKNNMRLLSLGSILHFAKDNDIIWGSGINGKISLERLKFEFLDIRIVRGPITAEILYNNKNIIVPDIYGDPGYLISDFIDKNQHLIENKFDYIVIPNLNDIKLFENSKNLVNPLWDWLDIVKYIVNSDFVISSALHGVILAESFNVPARVILPEGHAENELKYKDYYEGTGRQNVKFAKTITEAIKMGGVSFGNSIKENLMNTFPHDIFE